MHKLTFQILAVLQGTPADGQKILHRVRDLRDAGGDPSLPTLYRWLKSGLEEGWIESRANDDDPSPGRPSRIYELTDAGLEAVEAEAHRHRELAALVLGPETSGKRGER